MSSSMVAPRFHSFPEANLGDPLPQFPNSTLFSSNEPETMKKTETQKDVNGDSSSSGGWSFQFLANPSEERKESNQTEKENVYVHPLAKRSASSLSKKSLEMCTESLGSETGSEISDGSDEFCSLTARREILNTTQKPKSRDFTKKSSFPPPLTSISGSDGVQVRPRRENGRLVIEAVTVSSCSSFFQAERAGGRLRLCLVKNAEDIEGEEEETPQGKCWESDDVEGQDENSETIGGENEIKEGGYECDEFDDEEEWVEGVGENSGTFGYEIKIGEIPRPSRCYESGFERKGIQSWGAVWVAIS